MHVLASHFYFSNSLLTACLQCNEHGRALACDEDIFFSMDSDAVLCEDGDRFVMGCFANTHEGMRKISE
jgi:hypothetical protein